MAGASGPEMAQAVNGAGGLGALPCAMLDHDTMRAQIAGLRRGSAKRLNVNFFCHVPQPRDPLRERAWRLRLSPYYSEFDLTPDAAAIAPRRVPFDDAQCEIVEELKPGIVSFHFGLPDQRLLERVKACGNTVMGSATTVAEGVWLSEHGCDVVIAQGYEAGGHRGTFLTEDIGGQPGTMALVPQLVDAVDLPVVASGGIADGRSIAAAFALGAAAVQVGTAYLLTAEALISGPHRVALQAARDDNTALTNLFSGRPARGLINRLMREIGPLSADVPAFPTAGESLAPLQKRAMASGSAEFSPLWAGQSAALCREMSAAELTRTLARDALNCMQSLTRSNS